MRSWPAKRTWPIEILKPQEVEELLEATSRRTAIGARNRALIAILYFASLRISEALALEVQDLELASGTILVRPGSGALPRTSVINTSGIPLVEYWLTVRDSLGLGARSKLFLTCAGRPVDSSYVRAMLRRCGHLAGNEKRIHPHGLRHAHAHRLVELGVSEPDIQGQLGHASLAMAVRYLDFIAPISRIRRLRNLDWPRNP